MSIELLQKSISDHAAAVAAQRAEVGELKGQLNDLTDNIRELAQKSAAGYEGMPSKRQAVIKSALNDSAELQAMREGRARSAIIKADAGIGEILKAVVGDAGGVGDDPYAVETSRFAGMGNDARAPLPLLSLLPRLPVSTGSFEYISLDADYADAADYQVAQGDAKAVAALPTELLTANIATVAVTLPVSEQVLADSPALQRFIQSRLNYSVLKKLETELVGGVGGAGKIKGLLASGTAFTPAVGTTTPEDIAGEAVAHMQAIGWMPTAIVMHPVTFQKTRARRVDAGNGLYLAGSWAAVSPLRMWDIPVILSPAIAQNRALVVDTTQLVLLDRMNVVFEFGRSGTQFVENMVTARSELRAGLMVASPSAVQVLTI